MIISAAQLLIDGDIRGPACVAVHDGVITGIDANVPADPDHRVGLLTPGLIDLHNNGAFGVDFASATDAQWDHAIARLAACGVTSLLPTVITAPLEQLSGAAKRVRQAMARHPGILGLHLEGPFLAPEKAGAHRRDWLAPLTPEAVAWLQALPALRLLTLAPELPGAEAAIAELTRAGIAIALGHTAATAARMQAAAAAGARLVTHVFNAQAPLHHRAPGPAGVALTDPRLFPCLIADGLHVDPLLLKLAFAAHPNAVAVTDSILAAGEPEGFRGAFGGEEFSLIGGAARRPDGTLAGAAITLDEGIRRLIAAGVAPEVALAAATERPAAALELTDRGRLAVGCRADLIAWNSDFTIAQVWRAGGTDIAAPDHGTETVRAALLDLDERTTAEIIHCFLGQEQAALQALARAAPALTALADAVTARLSAGGRLFYAGAGTSGRLALLDAVECGPTFGVGEEMLVPLLAGGPAAFLQAVEGAEDDEDAAIAGLQGHCLSEADALVGIAASGRTPFTLAAIGYANSRGALTGAIVNNPATPMAAIAQIAVEIASGAEVIAGSTRLSAGTAQKIALNGLSSTVMIRLGKTFGPYMVDLRASNAKLRQRAIRITAALAQVPEPEAEAALAAADREVKTAIVMLAHRLDAPAARQRLARSGGALRAALDPLRR